MSVKKYLDYAGLQRYDDNWKLKFQEMIISNDEMEDMLFDVLGIIPDIPETWTESANGTLNLSLSNAFSYWPEGAGTKTISITNGTTSGLSSFFLKLTDAGNFFVEWGSNIEWKDGSEPEWQAFHEDIILFGSNDGGNTWTAQVLQTNEITPYWKFTIETEATASGEKKTGIPVNLYGQTGIELTVDWGDHTTSTLTPSDYTASDSTASVHEYAVAGEYTVTITSNDWENTYLLFYSSDISSDSDTKTSSLYLFIRTATSIDTKLPQIKGVTNANTLTAYNNSLKSLFYNSNKITSIPSGLFDNNTAVTSFQSCFCGCSSLQSIPSGLFDKNTAVTNFYQCFYDCSSLQSIPSGLFDNNMAVIDFSNCFSYCISLQSIPSGLFDKNTAVTYFSGCFQNCTSLASIPSGLFDKNTAVTDFYDCFYDCTSIQSIPSGLFDSNTAVTDFSSCFYGCTSIQSIPTGLFDNNTTATNFWHCFHNCTSLQSIPSGLFDNNTAATDFSYCFYGCTNLLNFHLKIGSSSVTIFSYFISNASNVDRILCVPANSTTYTTASSYANSSNNIIVSTDFIDCSEAWEFTIDTEATTSGEKKTGIPVNLYGQTGIELLVDWGDNTTSRLTPSNYTAATDTSPSVHQYAAAGEYTVTVASNDWENTYLLSYLYNISSDSNTKTSSLYWFRRTAISIDTKLPQIKGIVDADTQRVYNNSLQYLFRDSKKITSIPSGLFDNNTAVTNFSYCFYECFSLQSIPSGLFDKHTAVTRFDSCFRDCTSLQSIPAGLFDSNTAVTDFNRCFSGCTSLQSIPSGLFDKNTAVTIFYDCFRSCSSLTSIPSGLFDGITALTTFSSCFRDCTSLQSIPSGLFDKNTAVTSFYYCFYGCTSLQSIPSGLFDKNTAVTDFEYCFYGCTSLQSIPSGLFDKNTAVTIFDYCFRDCTSLQSIPSGLFANNTAVVNFFYCFGGCSSLTNFTLYIGSSLVSSCSSFVTKKSGTTRTVYVPANSTTKTTFDAQASSLGLTILTYTPA